MAFRRKPLIIFKLCPLGSEAGPRWLTCEVSWMAHLVWCDHWQEVSGAARGGWGAALTPGFRFSCVRVVDRCDRIELVLTVLSKFLTLAERVLDFEESELLSLPPSYCRVSSRLSWWCVSSFLAWRRSPSSAERCPFCESREPRKLSTWCGPRVTS